MITTNKNVNVISVEGQLPAPAIKRYSRHDEDSQTATIRQHYIAAKQLYKAEKIAAKQPGKISKTFYVPRSDKPIAVALGIDSTQKTVFIKPHSAYGCYLNMRYVFRKRDSLDPYKYKNWGYPRKSILTTTESDIKVSRFEPIKKGTVNMTISPGAQFLNLKRDTGRYDTGGIIGIELGADYFYRENRFLSFNAGAAVITPVFLGNTYALPTYEYYERASAIYASVRNNIVKGNFDIGYGLSLSRLYWTGLPYDDSLNLPERKVRTTGLGLSFSANYKLKQNFKVGILYQPNLVNINRLPVFDYQHYMTIHVTWNFATGKSVLKSNYSWRAK